GAPARLTAGPDGRRGPSADPLPARARRWSRGDPLPTIGGPARARIPPDPKGPLVRLPPRAPVRSLSCSFSLPLTSSLIASVWIASFAAPAAGAADGTAPRVAAGLGGERFRPADPGAAPGHGGPTVHRVPSAPDLRLALAAPQ